jgi:hypothetical protein
MRLHSIAKQLHLLAKESSSQMANALLLLECHCFEQAASVTTRG